MPRHLRAIALILFAAVVASAQEKPEPQYVKEYKAAGEHTFKCFGAKEEAACMAMIAAYERAMNAPDATEAVRHRIFKDHIHAITVHGSNLREKKGAGAALAVLEPAYAAVMRHFDGGKHFHALIDNLRLQQETALALAALGRHAEAERVLSTARRAADYIYDARESFKGDENKTKLLHMAYLGSEMLETEMADFYRRRSFDESKSAEADANRDRAIAAYRRAESWLRRKTDAGIRSMMDVRSDIRLAEIKLELGALLLEKKMTKEATEEFLTAFSISGALLDPKEAARFGVRPAEGLEVLLLKPVKERALLGWMSATGKLDEMISEYVDRMIELNLQMLKGGSKSPASK